MPLSAFFRPVGLRFVHFDETPGIESTRLPGGFHNDPTDRMITALAKHFNVFLVPVDKTIHVYKHVRSIW